jgi:hypothetical protein
LGLYKDFIDFKKLYKEQLLWPDYKNHSAIYNNICAASLTMNQSLNDVQKLVEFFKDDSTRKLFSQTYNLFRIYLTVPVSSATAERSFSALKFIKTWLRNATNQERLSDLSILKFEQKYLKSMLIEDIIDKFAHARPRRLKLF